MVAYISPVYDLLLALPVESYVLLWMEVPGRLTWTGRSADEMAFVDGVYA